jgi:hypothetical protein
VSGVGFTFPAATTMPAHGRIVLIRDPANAAAFRATFQVPADVPIFTYTGALDNSGETLRLQRPGPGWIDVDVVEYGPGSPWPGVAAGGGKTLQRNAVTVFGDDPANWHASTYVHGTPGSDVPAPPATPLGLSAAAVSSSRIVLGWMFTGINQDGFVIAASSDGTTFTTLATVDAGTRSYTHSGLWSYTTVHYRIRSYNAGGESAASATASATTPLGRPAAPGGLTASATSATSVDLQWIDNAGDEDGFVLERSDGSGFVQIATPAADAIAYNDSGLDPSTTYSYRVAAANLAGASAWSATATVTTLPAAPDGLSAVATSDTTVALAWADHASDETSFVVERDDGSGFVQVATLGTDVTTYDDSGLDPSTAYTYRVCAVSVAGPSAWAVTATTTLAPAPWLSYIYSLPDGVFLGWGHWPDDAGDAIGFELQRDDGDGFISLTTTAVDVTNYRDSGLAPSTTYFYRVRAVRPADASAWSRILSFTAPPPAPDGLSAIATSATNVDLHWVDHAGDETGFEVARGDDTTGFMPIAYTAANVTSFSDYLVEPSSTNTYRVRTRRTTSHYSAWSATATVTTPPNAPSLHAISVSADIIYLFWSGAAIDGITYELERDDGSGFVPLTSIAGTGFYYDEMLTASTTYTYRIRAVSIVGPSMWSMTETATTHPLAPDNLTATATSATTIDLQWTDHASDETGFVVERSDGSSFMDVATLVANTTTYSDSGLTAATTYIYRIRLVNAAGSSAWSATAEATTPATSGGGGDGDGGGGGGGGGGCGLGSGAVALLGMLLAILRGSHLFRRRHGP